MSSWYERKLAEMRGQQPAAPVAQPQYPPTQPLLPGQLPPHLAPYAQPVQQPVQPLAQPPAHYLQPGQQPQQGMAPQFTTYNAETGAQMADDGHVAALYMAAQTGGSQAVKQGSAQCPNCHGTNYFTVSEGSVFSKNSGERVHAMQCADCNYPQVQAGSTNGALQGVRTAPGSAAKSARQLPKDHVVTVIGEGGRPQSFQPATQR